MPDQPIALVLAGGGARGAYEAGVLSVLLPALPRDQRPNLIVGASVGAVNGAYRRRDAPGRRRPALAAGRAIWEHLRVGRRARDALAARPRADRPRRR